MATTNTLTSFHIRLRLKDALKFQERTAFTTQLVKELIELKESLITLMSKRLNNNIDPLTAIVEFMSLIAPWYDRLPEILQIVELFEKVNYGQYNLLLFNLHTLIRHFRNAGRNECGYNRTDRGQPVTASDIFLGGIEEIKLLTHSVSTWQKKADDTAGRNQEYMIVCQIAKEFMDSHIQLIVVIISGLETFLLGLR